MADVVVLYIVAVARVAVTILIEVVVAVVEAIVAVRVDVICQVSQHSTSAAGPEDVPLQSLSSIDL